MDWQQNLPLGRVDRPFHPESSGFSGSSSSSQSPSQRSTFLARYGIGTLPHHNPSCPSPIPTTSIAHRTFVLPMNTSSPYAKTDDTTDTPSTSWLTPPPSSDHENSSPAKPLSPVLSNQDQCFPPGSPSPRIPSPASVERLIESLDGKLTLNGITPEMLSEWEDLHPFVREADHINYEYDGSTSRMMIRCTVSPVHDSLQIFFKSHASAALLATLGKDRYIDHVQMSSGSAFGGFTGEWNVKSRKQPDAYLQIDGYDFPTVVCESGWAEKLDDLRRDATLWLMHTDGQTTVVIVVAFSEFFEAAEHASTPDRADGDLAPDGFTLLDFQVNVTADVLNEEQPSQTTISPSSGSPSGGSSEDGGPTEEEILLSTINDQTRPRDLAASLLDLHRRGRLSKPLLGRVDATVHIFRRNTAQTAIEETFTAILLPTPANNSDEQGFSLTMEDLLGDLAAEEGIDPDELVEFPLDQLRTVVAKQIPKFERLRAVDRTEQVMKKMGLWEEKETFAQSKRSRKRKYELEVGAAQGR